MKNFIAHKSIVFIWILIAVEAIFFAAYIYFNINKVSYNVVNAKEKEKHEAPSIFVPLLKPLVFEPKFLTIQKIALKDVKIVEVGVEADGRLQVPVSFDEVGWYSNGPKAGENGNAILAGHYDRVGGAPAVFYNLVKLTIGDKIEVKDAADRVLTFEIYDVSHVPINDPQSVTKAYGGSDKPILTLITCGGVWDFRSHDYSKRLLIKAKMVE